MNHRRMIGLLSVLAFVAILATLWRVIVDYVLLGLIFAAALRWAFGIRLLPRRFWSLAPNWFVAVSFAVFASKYEKPKREKIPTKPEPIYGGKLVSHRVEGDPFEGLEQ